MNNCRYYLSCVLVWLLCGQSLPSVAASASVEPTASAQPLLEQAAPAAELAMLRLYLQQPGGSAIAQYLAVYHLHQALGLRQPHQRGAALRHSILSQYFFQQLIQAGDDPWAVQGLKQASQISTPLLRSRKAPHATVSAVHQAFIQTFNLKPELRAEASAQLLQAVAEDPDNVLTSTYLMALSIWRGGEAASDDPLVLNHFILASHFGVRSLQQAKLMEQAWQQDPLNAQRFRLAPILGGLAVPSRLWLAQLHQQQDVVNALHQEHREWLAHNAPFHSITLGLVLFNDQQLFTEGLAAWQSGVDGCGDLSANRACGDGPYFSFNMASFWLSGVDFQLKAGRVDIAQQMLYGKYAPIFHFEQWTLGQEAWHQRETELVQRAALYQNEDPSDDPTNFLLKKRQWGPDTITCQACHQRQQRAWTAEEIANVTLPTEAVATIGRWPAIRSSWFGTLNTPAQRAEICQSMAIKAEHCVTE